MPSADIKIDFDAPAILKKWPSLRNERRNESSFPYPYLIQVGSLFECAEGLLSKPAVSHHLYEIHTQAQAPWVKSVLSAELVYELMRLRKVMALCWV
jgi:hypothetical protein